MNDVQQATFMSMLYAACQVEPWQASMHVAITITTLEGQYYKQQCKWQ